MAITGTHMLLYTTEPEKLRAMFRDVFKWHHVDMGDGWLIFRTPPGELGVHPGEAPTDHSGMRHQITFMCDDIHTTINDLRANGVTVQGDVERPRVGYHRHARTPWRRRGDALPAAPSAGGRHLIDATWPIRECVRPSDAAV